MSLRAHDRADLSRLAISVEPVSPTRPAALESSIPIQLSSARTRPEGASPLLRRLSWYAVVGVISTLVQGVLLFSLTRTGMSVPQATPIAVLLSGFVNFSLNYTITWRDRFATLSRAQRRRWFLPLFTVFAITTPTLWLEIAGITAAQRLIGGPLLLTWIAVKSIGSIVAFVGADRLAFGVMARVARHAASPSTEIGRIVAAWRAMRPEQWLKNVFANILAMPLLTTPRAMRAAAYPSGALCGTSANAEHRARVVALVPACNEEELIAQTIESLLVQTHSLDNIVVIANNCTDRTVEIALEYAAQHDAIHVMEIKENKGKKAGALNQALARLDPGQWDFVLQMDADTQLDSRLVEEGLLEFRRDPSIGGIGSRCFLKPRQGEGSRWEHLLWCLQNMEYGFGDSKRIQNGGRTNILAGAVCIYRMRVLLEVATARSRRKVSGLVWPEDSLVEDYELTLDTQRLGYRTEIGLRMFSWTDAMTSVKDLRNQRYRWYGGHAATLRKRKLAAETWKELLIQSFYVAVILSRLLLILAVLVVLATIPVTMIEPSWWWLTVVGLVMANYILRFRYVRNKDLTQYLLMLTLIPLELYITWDQTLTLLAYAKNVIKPSTNW